MKRIGIACLISTSPTSSKIWRTTMRQINNEDAFTPVEAGAKLGVAA